MSEPKASAEIDMEWRERAKQLLRAHMTLKGVNTAGLTEKLTSMGVQETGRHVANKIACGGFMAAFFSNA